MRIDGKSFIIGAIVGYCAILWRATVSVARDRIKEDDKKKEEA